MNSNHPRAALKELAENYALEKGLSINSSYKSAAIFTKLGDNFFPSSYESIRRNEFWSERLQKDHTQVPNAKEIQSSSSSDALLMSIFCHPKIGEWKGVRDLLKLESIHPEFGVKPGVRKIGSKGDKTEIDLALDGIFVEAKLTESGFTEKAVLEVEAYSDLQPHFHVDLLSRKGEFFDNYQVIRNLLAAIQCERRHLLFCDERRPDLVRAYFQTVGCLREGSNRKRCGVIFWQEIARVCGRDLREFLALRYGIF